MIAFSVQFFPVLYSGGVGFEKVDVRDVPKRVQVTIKKGNYGSLVRK